MCILSEYLSRNNTSTWSRGSSRQRRVTWLTSQLISLLSPTVVSSVWLLCVSSPRLSGMKSLSNSPKESQRPPTPSQVDPNNNNKQTSLREPSCPPPSTCTIQTRGVSSYSLWSLRLSCKSAFKHHRKCTSLGIWWSSRSGYWIRRGGPLGPLWISM